MKTVKIILPLVAIAVAAPALAKDPVVQPVQVGSETVRYVQGSATLDLRQTKGAVQVRPLPMDHGSLAFAVAVFNGGDTPANIDTGNFVALAGKQTLSPFTMQQLAGKAKSRARWKQFGVAMLGGLGAAAAASQRDYYSGTTFTPYGTYHSTFSAPSVAGQFQAAAITAGTAYSIVKLQQQLDGALNALAENVVQTTTIEPGQTYGGKIVFTKISGQKLPQRVHLTVSWNGEQYPFAFQLAKDGTPAPVFQAITPTEDMRGLLQPFSTMLPSIRT